MTDTPEMFEPTRGFFGDGRFNETIQNVLGPTLVAMATKFGLGLFIYNCDSNFLDNELGQEYCNSSCLSVCRDSNAFS